MTDSHNPKTSRNKAIITAITTCAMTPTQAAKHFHLLRSQTYKLLRKYKQRGTTALTPQSTRPTHTQPKPQTQPCNSSSQPTTHSKNKATTQAQDPYDNTYNKQDTNHHMNPQSNANSNRQD